MSGALQVTPIQVPDFGATLARAEGLQANRLAMLAQQRSMQQDDALQAAIASAAPALGSSNPQERLNALTALAQSGPRGLQVALPLMGEARDYIDLYGGGGPSASPGAPATATPAPGGSMPSPGDPSLPRGLRNNNPLNLSFVQGQPGVQGSDGRFGIYATPEEGIAAGVRQLQLYAQRGVTTLAGIINRWAPPNENNTGGYVAAVARATGLRPNEPVDLSNPAVVTRLVGAMAQMENGRPLDPAIASRGVQMALGGGSAGGGGEPRAIPTQATPPQAGAQPQAGAPGVPTVAGVDMGLVQRALQLPPSNRAGQAILQRYYQLAQLQQRDTAVEVVADPNSPTGRSYRLRSSVAGMAAPAPEGPQMSEELRRIEELGPLVARGAATEQQVRQYLTAANNYQQTQTRSDGTTVTPRLPPYAPGLDVLQQMYPAVFFQAPGAAAPAAAPGAPGAIPAAAQPPGQASPISNPDVQPAVPPLPPPGPAAPGLPSAGGGAQRDPSAMQPTTRTTLEGNQFNAQETLSSLNDIQRQFRPEFQQIGPRISARWASIRDRAGVGLSPRDTQFLQEFSAYRASAMNNFNQILRAMSGAAVTPQEYERLRAVLPDAGTGVFDGDSPAEFQAKLDRATESTRRAIMRHNWALSRGLNRSEQFGIELQEIPQIYERRAREIEAEIRTGNPGLQRDQLRQQTRAQLFREFGM